MSTGIVHQPDTPVSSGSPASVGIETETSKLDCFGKNDELVEDSCSTPPMNENEDCHSGSSSSSPAMMTPTLSFTPPTNGILTPPNDADISIDSGKSDKGSGRLKFYKDGVLCLELSHHDEGEKRKWVQIRSKTIFPTVVHTKKEVTIPRHVSPSPSFHSPLSVTNSLQQRLESSASHSTSDDGSSMLSSPRIRESSWRKPVPHKGVSLCLEFLLKSAPCVKQFRKHYYSKIFQSPQNYRKPCNYNNYDKKSINYLQKTPGLKCSCDIFHSLNDKCEAVVEDTLVENSSTLVGKGGGGDQENIEKKRRTKSPSLEFLVKRLHHENEKQFKLLASIKNVHRAMDHHQQNDRRATSDHHHYSSLPKKRSFKETDMKDSSPLRPAKLSPKSKSVKTILNIPGFNNEFSKCSTTISPENEIDRGSSSSYFAEPSSSSSLVSNNFDGRQIKPDASTRKKSGTNRVPHNHYESVAGVVNYTSVAKPPRKSPTTSPSTKHLSLNSSSSIQSAMYLSSLPPEQQQIFQQQTMSKAISYTINSLLSPHNNQESSLSSLRNLSGKLTGTPQGKDKTKAGKRELNKSSNVLSMQHASNYFGIKGDHDQNSFLRHLLDTSDPIPNPTLQESCKSEVVPAPNPNNSNSGSSTNNNNNNINKGKQQSQSASDVRKTSSKSKEKLQQQPSATIVAGGGGGNVHPTSSQQQFQHQLAGFFPPAAAFMQPSLFGAGFPLHLQGYESLFGGHHPSVGALAAAAAAAELQYQSLLPPSILQQMNPSMAAVMAASYLGASPSGGGLPPTSSSSSSGSMAPSSRSPPNSRRSENYNNNSNRNNNNGSKSIPLNLSQRGISPGGTTPSGASSIPVPFHAPSRDNPHSRIGSASRNSSSRGRLTKALDVIDDEVPLNLSKRT
ncbi:protein hairless-like isoform X2 [Folsomia candida]|uniref:protein hairless-like isoform X2 n=1 Tax=Folsomia candida TaxID=158441 RepID=UPI001604BFD2|nr:protein hairless-like isoform X2 [Folsomia candida]